MILKEGRVYEGGVSLTGSQGPWRRWIVVAPFGKYHIHSIDDPLEVRCWPLTALSAGLESGLLVEVGDEPDHPCVRLQRAKERAGIADTHLGLYGWNLRRMLELFERAVAAKEDYAPYAAGEILGLIVEMRYTPGRIADIRDHVYELLGLAPPAPGLYAVGTDSAPRPGPD